MGNTAWLLVSAALVFIMQAGFLCLESGRIRNKNSINVAAKNISDFILSSLSFWLVGFGLMFGQSYSGVIGVSYFAPDSLSLEGYGASFLLFQMMFCGTAATLVSGAVAERMTFMGYLLITLVLGVFIYPIQGHWAWNSVYSGNETQGWLEAMGFIDFAGSTVVHSVGGWVALIAIYVIGARHKRFSEGVHIPQGSNLPLAGLGALLIWFGWIGFNGGSALELNSHVSVIIMNTFLSAAWGGAAAAVSFYLSKRYVDVTHLLNGVIAGLVGITAGCHVMSGASASIVGIVSGIIVILGSQLMEHLKLDDALDVVPAHLFAGIWGTLAVALLGDKALFGTGYSRLAQFEVQLIGVVSIGLYCVVVSYIFIRILSRWVPMRVSIQDEEQGLNKAEHLATTELIDLLDSMEDQHNKADFSSQVPVEPFTEVGQIAKKYNSVLEKVNQEIAERDQALFWFKESEMRKTAILNSSMDAIVTIDGQGTIVEFNPAAERTFGMLKKQVKAKNFISLFVGKDKRVEMSQSLSLGFSNSQGLVLNRRNNFTLLRGETQPFPVEITITKAVNDHGQFQEFTLHIRDITRHIKLQQRLKFLAYSDPLTSLHNRTFMAEQLERSIKVANQAGDTVALLFLDLDKFKLINDTLGHKAGDELLCEVASRLNSISHIDDVIARWGGDEFLIMVTDKVSKPRIEDLANRILTAMKTPFLLEGKPVEVATSVGIALSEKDETAEKLIQRADSAMYAAKQSGRGVLRFYDEHMSLELNDAYLLEKELVVALDQRQFVLHYQPIYDASANQLVQFEALIRWNHPDKGNVPPIDFIPIAEESHLICLIGEYVIDESLKLIASLTEQDIDIVPISINVSGRHLMASGFIEYMEDKLKFYGINGRFVKVEVTEGVFLHDTELCADVMRRLKHLGIEISVDDFGTGYSSLYYLKSLPIDTLKIDKSFVKECHDLAEGHTICESIIRLAQGLALEVIAEGVETNEQAETLIEWGCNKHQGYYYCHPVDEEKAVSILKELVEPRKNKAAKI
ncbi:ammonium transporter [Marinomonas mediterranea]|jgi:diguanylate cyclase/phosphodiesterase with PAS/PAC sensor(s)/ammonium transporter|uniref:Diguanylate cyclase/phosphodiesterase with PAS/PAC sensor(S) n=1 Tax=Marinomonas mediterranea (strain ATCC 700492 / JCM 21426 / NBRC 103028 / MMB-1) TaxID=717774 RepID=F2K3C3_MARM1|nr:ammonium transporter [Marinomonas mediterranea]ADZ91265.1 diguanylate cyclase/phosphodiesterase with PAS/PAC sensor(s) [Marinomonas mediterranea MMB-1]WCN09237.1 ammonium transporter [Marinomonas mediterranea]WCN13319.1 ammonium transporter [Marinomonas mediterranea]WCN17387.1 ammonium transporter [Marinomonas mediterranea MMB-1]